MKTIAIMAAAGRGERFGGARAKIWTDVSGKPLVYYSLSCVERAYSIDGIMVMAPPDDVDTLKNEIARWGFGKVLGVVPGGERRQDTVRKGIEAIPGGYDMAVIHDAARPLASPELFRRVIEAAERVGAATAAIEPVDTVICLNKKNKVIYLDRKSLRTVQTPQAFRVDILREAHSKADEEGIEGTDDAGLALRIGRPVEVVRGEPLNFKITYPHDIETLKAILSRKKSTG